MYQHWIVTGEGGSVAAVYTLLDTEPRPHPRAIRHDFVSGLKDEPEKFTMIDGRPVTRGKLAFTADRNQAPVGEDIIITVTPRPPGSLFLLVGGAKVRLPPGDAALDLTWDTPGNVKIELDPKQEHRFMADPIFVEFI